EGSSDRAAELAAEFVRLKVDVIVTYANPMVVATKQATSVIPIVFAAAADPVGTGLVAGLARPGGKVTGLSAPNTDLAAKRVGILRDLIPGLRWLAIIANVDNSASVLEMREVQAAARTIGLEVATLEIRRGEDIAPAFEGLKGRADAPEVRLEKVRTDVGVFGHQNCGGGGGGGGFHPGGGGHGGGGGQRGSSEARLAEVRPGKVMVPFAPIL